MKNDKQIAFSGPEDVQDRIICYLLDQMAEDERTPLEERLVRDPFFFDLVAAVEDDLIMRYLRDELNDHMASRFSEVYTSSPSKRARLDFARAWCKAVKDVAKTRRAGAADTSRARFRVVAAAAAIIVAAVLWSLWRYQAPSGSKGPEKIASTSFLLESGLTRSEGGREITLPPGVNEVRLELILPDAAVRTSYRVVLATPERQVWSGPASLKNANLVTTIPANVLVPGDYTLELQEGGNNIATYYFRVPK